MQNCKGCTFHTSCLKIAYFEKVFFKVRFLSRDQNDELCINPLRVPTSLWSDLPFNMQCFLLLLAIHRIQSTNPSALNHAV